MVSTLDKSSMKKDKVKASSSIPPMISTSAVGPKMLSMDKAPICLHLDKSMMDYSI